MAKLKGGKKLDAYIKNSKRAAAKKLPLIEVGFKDRRIAVLAGQLEFGNPESNLPERPAFRSTVRKRRESVNARVVELMRANLPQFTGLTKEQWVEIAILVRDIVRQEYEEFHGAPLSERQRQRKEDTPFADEQLIGAEGPRLIEHIKAYMDGVEVG